MTVSCKRGLLTRQGKRTERTKEERRGESYWGGNGEGRGTAAEPRLIENDKMTSHEGDVCQLQGAASLFFPHIKRQIAGNEPTGNAPL